MYQKTKNSNNALFARSNKRFTVKHEAEKDYNFKRKKWWKSLASLGTTTFIGSVCGAFCGSLIGAPFAGVCVGGCLGWPLKYQVHRFIDWAFSANDKEEKKYNFYKMYEDLYIQECKKIASSEIDVENSKDNLLEKIQSEISKCYDTFMKIGNKDMGDVIVKSIQENHPNFCNIRKKSGFEKVANSIVNTIGAVKDGFAKWIGIDSDKDKVATKIVTSERELITELEKTKPEQAVASVVKLNSNNMQEIDGYFTQDHQQNVISILKKIYNDSKEPISIKFSDKQTQPTKENEFILTKQMFVSMNRYLSLKNNLKHGNVNNGYNKRYDVYKNIYSKLDFENIKPVILMPQDIGDIDNFYNSIASYCASNLKTTIKHDKLNVNYDNKKYKQKNINNNDSMYYSNCYSTMTTEKDSNL